MSPDRDRYASMLDRDGHATVRSLHARRYVVVARPLVVGLAMLSWPVAYVIDPDAIEPQTAPLLIGAAIVVAASIVALRWWSARAVASASILLDTSLVVASILAASEPADTAVMLLWPVIAMAYFAGWRLALALTAASSALCIVLAWTLPAWDDPRPVPVVAITIAVIGMLLAFVIRQSRAVELQLARTNARNRHALEMSRHVRMAPGPEDACEQIAREIVRATGASFAAVALFEHDSDYVTEVKHYDDGRSSATFAPSMLDATLRHLASGGLAAIHGPSGTSLHPIEDVDGETVGTTDAGTVRASFAQLASQLGYDAGLLVPMVLGGRAIGALVLAGAGDDWQDDALYLMEPLAPQLAAGLAQSMLMRDQRDALESLERVDRMRDRLIANVSHELRTPLTSTIGFVETLLRSDVELDEPMRTRLMEHARDGGLRLLALVEDLLALGTTRPESLDLDAEPALVSQLVADAIRGIEPPDGRRIEVLVDDDGLVAADRNRMLQVVANLVVNGIHHGAGDVEVRCHVDGSSMLVDVVDEGRGVAPEHEHELFLPFARFSTRSDSTGLGLAICRTIVEAHGGTIDYDRIAGERTRFRVRVPLAASAYAPAS